MLEVVLAISVLAAVVVVGVLISIGNERQRKAIEQLRDDVRNWALGIWKSNAKRHPAIFKSSIHWRGSTILLAKRPARPGSFAQSRRC